MSIGCCFLFVQYAAHISSFLDGLCVFYKKTDAFAVQGSNRRKFSRFTCSHSKFFFSFLVCLNVEFREFVVWDQGFDVGLG